MDINEIVSQAVAEAGLSKYAGEEEDDSNITDLVGSLKKMADQLEAGSFYMDKEAERSENNFSKLASMIVYNECVKEAYSKLYHTPEVSEDNVDRCANDLAYKDAYLSALDGIYS